MRIDLAGRREAVAGKVRDADRHARVVLVLPHQIDAEEIEQLGPPRSSAHAGKPASVGERVDQTRLAHVRTAGERDLWQIRGRTPRRIRSAGFELGTHYAPALFAQVPHGNPRKLYTSCDFPLRLPGMDVFGLTGGIGSGKSVVARMLEAYGIPVVSADELARVVVARGSEGLREVVDAFGAEVLGPDRELDRRRLAQLVFEDPSLRRTLEGILHPKIRERYHEVLDVLRETGHRVALYEVPLLFERGLDKELKGVVLVTATDAHRIARVRDRDNLEEGEIRSRMAAQMAEDTKRERADYVIDNDGDLDDLRREVEFMIKRFLRVERVLAQPGTPAEIMAATTIPAELATARAKPPRPPT